jgi:hypothetical protein
VPGSGLPAALLPAQLLHQHLLHALLLHALLLLQEARPPQPSVPQALLLHALLRLLQHRLQHELQHRLQHRRNLLQLTPSMLPAADRRELPLGSDARDSSRLGLGTSQAASGWFAFSVRAGRAFLLHSTV